MVREEQHSGIDDDTRARARQFVDDADMPKPAVTGRVAPKQRIVSKKELEESGLSLRDFLNRERGLTRRGESSSATKTPPSKSASVTDTGDEIDRLKARAPAPQKKSTYETAYDKMNRQNRETAASRKSAADEERAKLAKNIRESRDGKVNSKTLLPETGMKKGGKVSSASKRADGIAQRGKTRA
jgi:hypothetical protein